MDANQKRQLDRDGFVVLPGLLAPGFLRRLVERIEEIYRSEGEAAGSEFKQEPGARRLANLVDKGEVFQAAIAMPEILEAMEFVLGPRFKLSSLNARSALPRSDCRQPLHADTGAVIDEKGSWVCNSIWMLDDFTPENGAFRVVPGSHLFGKLPGDALDDPYAPHPDEVLVTGAAGTVVILNAHAWHGGTANRTSRARRALHAFYTRWDKPQQQYQKELLRPETQARLSPTLRRLLALDDPLNDEVSSKMGYRSGFMK